MANPLNGKVQFLADGQAIRRAVKRIFKNELGRRVALVAFVGKNASAYLPRPKGLELICWPQASGTNPTVISDLIKKKKVRVQFSNQLHMKVYWTATKGAVVASANLSMNAYGHGGLHEAGVLLPSSAINIDDVIDSVNPYEVTPEALSRLKIEHKQIKRSKKPAADKKTFLDWIKKPQKRPWKLDCFDAYGGSACSNLRDVAKEEKTRVEDWFFCRKDSVKEEDYILNVDLGSRRKPIVDGWLFVHRVVPVRRRERQYDSRWPYQAGQLYPPSACPQPPFHLDGYFRTALRQAYKALGQNSEREFSEAITRKPSKRLLKLLETNYRVAMRAE